MRRIKNLLLTAVMLLLVQVGFAQQKQITGTVYDSDDFTLPGASVLIKGTTSGTGTDMEGNFKLSAKSGDVLIVSFLGYNAKEVIVGTEENYRIVLTAADNQLDELVVLGYGKTATKPTTMGSVVSISSAELADRPNTSLLNSLQGTAPGLAINSNSGSPGSGKIDVKIRGINSISSSRDPLFVIDGVATSATQFRNLNPEDIDNISVLKDSQATSIYGNRGANGVVVITTKAGKYGSGLEVSYSGLTTVSSFPKDHYDISNAQQYLTIQRGAGYNSLTDSEIAAEKTTDWKKEFMNSQALSTQHTLGLRFGGENLNVYSSIGYLENEGNFKSTDFKRFTFRNTINGRSNNERFTYNAQVAISNSRRHQLDQETNTNISNNSIQNPLFGYLMGQPNLERYRWANGREMFNEVGGNWMAPWILSDIINGGVKNRFTENNVFASVSGRYKITDLLSVGNRLGVDYRESVRNFSRTPNGYLSVLVADGARTEFGGFDQIANTRDVTINNVLDLTFQKSFGLNTITATAFLEYTKAHYEASTLQQNGLNPLNWSFGAGTGWVGYNPLNPNQYVPTISAQKINAGTLAYFGTVDYDYDTRFGVSGTLRRDGSYRFSKENRWETFWSVAGRWNIDKEEFLQNTSVRMLKLRGSYGTTGNQNLIVAANNLNPLFTGPSLVRQLYTTATGYQGNQGFALGTLANSNIKWETVTQANIGVDFDVLNGKLSGSLDVYNKKTTNMFNTINVSAITGSWNVQGNNGSMQNRGIEALLRYNVLNSDDYNLSFFANVAYNKNKILAMDVENLTGDNVQAVGGVMNQWHLYKYVGVNQATGEQQYLDRNGNITEAPVAADRVLTGKTPFAPWTGGFGLNSSYKGFFLDVLFSYQAGGWSYDNMYSWLMNPAYASEDSNVSSHLLNSWTPNNTNTNIPSLTASNQGTQGSSDRFLYKTDFLRLKNVTFGYSFRKSDLDKLPVKSLKLFVTGENLFTSTNWKGFDPEVVTNYSLSVYPNPKSVSFGLNIGL